MTYEEFVTFMDAGLNALRFVPPKRAKVMRDLSAKLKREGLTLKALSDQEKDEYYTRVVEAYQSGFEMVRRTQRSRYPELYRQHLAVMASIADVRD